MRWPSRCSSMSPHFIGVLHRSESLPRRSRNQERKFAGTVAVWSTDVEPERPSSGPDRGGLVLRPGGDSRDAPLRLDAKAMAPSRTFECDGCMRKWAKLGSEISPSGAGSCLVAALVGEIRSLLEAASLPANCEVQRFRIARIA